MFNKIRTERYVIRCEEESEARFTNDVNYAIQVATMLSDLYDDVEIYDTEEDVFVEF